MKHSGKKIGIMGGTFDPVHIGHLILAESAMEQYQLDEVCVMPNGNPKYKSEQKVTDVKHRLEMVRLSIEQSPKLILSDIEAKRTGYTYTYETLEQMKLMQPDDTFYFIIGADSLFSFESWKHPERITADCVLLVANRNHVPMKQLLKQVELIQKKYHAEIHLIDFPAIDISSELLRDKVQNGLSIRYYVTDRVAEYIKEHKLYEKI